MAKVKTKKPAGKATSKAKPPKKVSKPVLKKTATLKPVKSLKVVKIVKAAKTNGAAAKSKPSKAKGAVTAPPKNLSAEMLRVRARLTQMLTELHKDIAHEVRGASERDLAHINDTSDMASDAADGDLALRIAESETLEAGEIETAIEKIDNGTYGKCEICNTSIGADRLEVLPSATLCIKCQELAEIRKEKEAEELDDLAEGTEDAENN